MLYYGIITALISPLFFIRNWRHSVKIALYILVVEGAIRKWLLPQFSDLIYLVKDLILIGAYIGYFITSEKKEKVGKLSLPVVILIFLVFEWCLLLSALNPRLGSPIVGLVGLLGYMINVPLIWIVGDLFRSEKELAKFLRNYLLLIIPTCLLGLVQFFSAPSSRINIYAGPNIEKIATFGEGNQLARISGPFAYLDSYVVYLTVIFCLLIPMFAYEKQKIWRFTYILEISLVVVNLFMTGSRSGIYIAVFYLFAYLFTLASNRFADVWQVIKQFVLPTIIGILVVSQLAVFHTAFDAFFLRATAGGDSMKSRIFHTINDPFDFIEYAGVFGYGTGATQGASKAIGNLLRLPLGESIPVSAEEEPGRIMLEIGLIGFILWYSLRFAILMALWSTFRKLRRPFLKQLALSAVLLNALQFTDQLVTHPVFSLYYWFLSGFILLLPKLEQRSPVQYLPIAKKFRKAYATTSRILSPSRS